MENKLIKILCVLLIFISLAILPIYAGSDRNCLRFEGDCNCYLYGPKSAAVLIDAGADAGNVVNYARQNGYVIKTIILTHGHWDHFSRVRELKYQTQANLIIHRNDLIQLQNKYPGIKPDGIVNGGEIIKVGSMNLEIIHTPGHSPGSICIKEGEFLFSGDTLFKLSIGRTTFEGGSTRDMAESLRKLMQFDDSLRVCPGHGELTSIGVERAYNPFLQ